MRFRTSDDLQVLIDSRIPEAASLEYKSTLALGPNSERIEALKDLTGIGNGGGGTIVYGVAEGSGDWPVATNFVPLTDRTLISRLENIARSGVQPPLLAEFVPIELDEGYALAVDVQPCPLGPYMVEAYGQRRYHIRRGRHVDPMSEREVRDAYALSSRMSERRPQLWRDHGLPMQPPTDEAWLIVSALPAEPLTDILDMLTATAKDLQPPPPLATYMNNWSAGDFTPMLHSLVRWLDGFYGHDDYEGGHREIRLHRDGAAAIASRIRPLDGVIYPTEVARVANTSLLYLGWFWERFGLARPTDVLTALHNVSDLCVHLGSERGQVKFSQAIAGPPGLIVDPITKADLVMAQSARRASVRHTLLMRFIDRLYQAAGEMRSEGLFRRGALYDLAGEALNVSVGGGNIWDSSGNHQLGWVLEDGMIVSCDTGNHAGWYEDGVVVDLNGDAVAVLELAPGVGCPDGFVGSSLRVDPDEHSSYLTGTPQPARGGSARAPFTGRWSAADLRTILGN